MQLHLRILSFKGESCHEHTEASIGALGGCIGRREECALVLLNDPSVSRQHGKITYHDGLFIYQDTSSNGTRLLHQDRLLSNESITLRGGEVLGIGDYSIECILDANNPDPIYPIIGASSSDSCSSPATSSTQNTEDYGVAPIISSASLLADPPAGSDPFMELLLGIDNVSFDRNVESSSVRRNENEFDDSTPVVSEELDNNVNSSLIASVDLYHAFLRGTGIQDRSPSVQNLEELHIRMEQVGRLLRAFVEGIAKALQARAELKRQMRVSVTTLEAANNNPLKFSSNTEQMIELMLDLHTQGFKDSVLAVKEGFDDLVSHQLAMSAGLQGSLLSVLKRFDPLTIEATFDHGLVFQRKSKCWDDYCSRYPSLVTTAIEDIFGDEFADTYEKQLDKLKISKD